MRRIVPVECDRAPDAACSSSIMLTPMRSIRSPRLLVAFLVVGFFAEMAATFAIRRKAFVVGVAVMRRDGRKRVAIGGAPRCLPIPGGRAILAFLAVRDLRYPLKLSLGFFDYTRSGQA